MQEIPKELQKARVALMFDHPFFASLALQLEPVEKKEMNPPTMATDGTHLFYHPDFLKNVTLGQLQGVIAHEIMHIILDHIERRQGREPLRWNIAADYAGNDVIGEEFELSPGALRNKAYHDKEAEWIYQEIPVKVGGGSGDGEGESTLDSHDEWKDWGKKEGDSKDGTGEGKDSSQKNADGLTPGEALKQEWKQRVAQAVNEARMQGKLPAHIEQLVGDLLQPKLDWKSMLQDMVTSCAKNDFRMFPANKKHLYRGIYLPSVTGETISVAVGIDSSGSISDEEIKEFLSEVQGICDTYDDYTVYGFVGDAAVHQRFELHPFDDTLPRTAKGRGGTDFRPIIAEAEKLDDITSLVYFTDGYGDFPDKEPKVNVIWVCTTDYEFPWGFVIRYPRNK